MTCVHFLELAIAIQNQRDPAERMRMLRALEEPARSPVLAWLWADAERSQTSPRRDLCDALVDSDAVGV